MDNIILFSTVIIILISAPILFHMFHFDKVKVNDSRLNQYVQYLIITKKINSFNKLKQQFKNNEQKSYYDYLYQLMPQRKNRTMTFLIQEKSGLDEYKVRKYVVTFIKDEIIELRQEKLFSFKIYYFYPQKIKQLKKWNEAFSKYDQDYLINDSTEMNRIINYLELNQNIKNTSKEYKEMEKIVIEKIREKIKQQENYVTYIKEDYENYHKNYLNVNQQIGQSIIEDIRQKV